MKELRKINEQKMNININLSSMRSQNPTEAQRRNKLKPLTERRRIEAAAQQSPNVRGIKYNAEPDAEEDHQMITRSSKDYGKKSSSLTQMKVNMMLVKTEQ